MGIKESLEQLEKATGVDVFLPEGQFFADIYLSYTALVTLNGNAEHTVEILLLEKIDKYLSVLSKGTGVVSQTRLPNDQLSLCYRVIFNNPLLKQFKEVKLNEVLMAEIVNDKIEQFTLLTGIDYIRHDGTSLI